MTAGEKNRITALIFMITLTLFVTFMLTACAADQNQTGGEELTQSSEDVPDYEIVEISTENYREYLTIGVELGGSNIEYIGQNSLGLDRYVLSCVGNVRINRTGNYQFNGVSIFCTVMAQGWHNGMISTNIELNYDGEGQYSFQLSKESSSSKFDLTSSDCVISVYGAKGTVHIYK